MEGPDGSAWAPHFIPGTILNFLDRRRDPISCDGSRLHSLMVLGSIARRQMHEGLASQDARVIECPLPADRGVACGPRRVFLHVSIAQVRKACSGMLDVTILPILR